MSQIASDQINVAVGEENPVVQFEQENVVPFSISRKKAAVCAP